MFFINFNILLFISSAMILLDNSKGLAHKENCSMSFASIKPDHRRCYIGNSEKHICHPYDILSNYDGSQKRKPSRRFSINAFNPEDCPAGAEFRNFSGEFSSDSKAFLDDYNLHLFLELTTSMGADQWRGCARLHDMTAGTAGVKTGSAKVTTVTTNNSTKNPEHTTNSTDTTPAPLNVMEKVMPNSYKLPPIGLHNNCTLSIFAEQTKKKSGQFAIHLLHNTPEPVTGIGETMLLISVKDEKIAMRTRFGNTTEEKLRKGLFDSQGIKLNIRVFNDIYVVEMGGKTLINITNNDHPLWAINYTYITGDLKVKDIPTLTCATMAPRDAPSIDWSNKSDDTMPEDLKIQNLEFKSSGSLTVYLLKSCPKFDMTVCTFAMEYKFTFLGEGVSSFTIKVYSRQLKEGTEMPTDKRIEEVPMTNVSIVQGAKYNMTISLSLDRGIGLWVHGQKWKKAKMDNMDDLAFYIYNFVEFVQVLTEGEVKIDHWQLETGPRPTVPFNDKKFEEGKTEPTWIMDQKLKNWDNGDYVKLRIKMIDTSDKKIHLVFYRGYPKWLTNPITGYHTGQKMLQIVINPKDGIVNFETEYCNWIKIRNIVCPNKVLTSERISANKKLSLQSGAEYMIHIIAQKNNTNDKYGYKLDVLDTKNTSLASYLLAEGPPYYSIEYFSLFDTKARRPDNLVLAHKPKFCKVDDKKC